MLRIVIRSLLLIVALASAPSAQANEWLAEIGYGQVKYELSEPGDSVERRGAEFALGYRIENHRFALDLMPLSAIRYVDDDPRYRRETFSNGRTVCRDTTNGQFSNSSNCDQTDLDYAALIRVGIAINEDARLFIGARLGSKMNAFGEFKGNVNKNTFLYVRAGRNYLSIGIGFQTNR